MGHWPLAGLPPARLGLYGSDISNVKRPERAIANGATDVIVADRLKMHDSCIIHVAEPKTTLFALIVARLASIPGVLT